jgi:short-subunit dehydrogenase
LVGEAFASAGAKVVLAAIDAEGLEHVTGALKSAGHEAIGVLTDITQQEQVDALMARTVETFGQLDVLVNCAGRSTRGEALATSIDKFRELLELNFFALVRCTQAAAPHLIQSRGHLVNIGSLAAKTAPRYLGAYPASKFPVAAYSQQLRYELGPLGVHVLLVCPGPIARIDASGRYDEEAAGLPESARLPGAGAKLKGIRPEKLVAKMLRYCERRKPELVMPRRARLLFAISSFWPSFGDWIIRKMT